ncbi:hypothetical protein B0A69_08520 [Chryseobacterium shigense]|uniref:Tetratricopeptide repeat-containing protein n=1 Tax=Chryseobacterium shigense TaxID=297244 RepID=A0A1N7IFN1_9FLAO|nr:hypothetical protein [Chryseobacterium shigense]PQA94500.1 hypothetical protein B0A69_08520 [Chryseobacterium shigense]SIS35860.1 hypothetical protein SAMN05421639_103491 [Chryseobacterium shigense]
MKKLILAFFFCISLSTFAQSGAQVKDLFQKIKEQAKIDKNDRAVYEVLDEFYNKNLQAENDEMTPEMVQRIEKMASDPNTKNLHILMLFLMYQQHISRTSMAGKAPDTEFQIETMNILENETREVYGKVPAIIYIYKAESLDAAGKKNEAKLVLDQGLKEYPDSVPLKVYRYLNTKDEALKNDLVKNHPNHWMVQQFGIK